MAYILPISLETGKGPSKWDFVLNLFDQHPAGAHGLRNLCFPLACGGDIHLEVKGIDKPKYPSLAPWEVRGYTTTLPRGYMQVHGPGNLVEVTYNPTRKQGWVNLQIVCPTCMENVDWIDHESLNLLGCPEHGHLICVHGGTNEWLWLEGARKGMREMRVTGRPGSSSVVPEPGFA